MLQVRRHATMNDGAPAPSNADLLPPQPPGPELSDLLA
jgi:hypothetical protein